MGDVLELYDQVGWAAYTKEPERLKAGLEGSLLTLAAYDGGRLMGLIRAVGDGQTIVYIQDIAVAPSHQRKGMGTALVKAMLARFGSVRQMVLMTDDTPRTNAFYTSLGFRPMEAIGCRGFVRL